MRKTRTFVVVATLGAMGLFAACGGDEPAPRSFENQPEASNPAKKPPAQVKSQVALSYKKGKFHVDVSADRDYCVENRTVTLLELGKRKDVRVGKVKTDSDGIVTQTEKKAAGKFVAELKKEPSAKYGALSVCLGDQSKPVKV